MEGQVLLFDVNHAVGYQQIHSTTKTHEYEQFVWSGNHINCYLRGYLVFCINTKDTVGLRTVPCRSVMTDLLSSQQVEGLMTLWSPESIKQNKVVCCLFSPSLRWQINNKAS